MTLSSLRPMNVGDILDQAFSLYRKDFLTLIFVIAVVSVPVSIVQLTGTILAGAQFLTFFTPAARAIPSLSSPQGPLIILGIALVVVATLLGALGGVVQTGALASVLSERFQGRAVTVRQAYARAFARWRPLLAMSLLLGLATTAIFGVVAVPFIATFAEVLVGASGPATSSNGLEALVALSYCGLCLVLPLLIVVYFALYPRWMFAPQAIVVENVGGVAGLRRSWQLVSGSFLRVLGIYIMMSILISVLTSGPTYAVQIGVSLLPNFAVATILNQVIVVVISLLVQPLQFAILTLLYFDLRIRKEGYDLELLAQQQLEAAQRYPAAT